MGQFFRHQSLPWISIKYVEFQFNIHYCSAYGAADRLEAPQSSWLMLRLPFARLVLVPSPEPDGDRGCSTTQRARAEKGKASTSKIYSLVA